VPFNQSYWEQSLLPRLTSFYHEMYLPAAVQKENGELLPPTESNGPDA
jgi:hypothetical protein